MIPFCSRILALYFAFAVWGAFPCVLGARVYKDDKNPIFDVHDGQVLSRDSCSSSQHICLNKNSRSVLPLRYSSTSLEAGLQPRSEEAVQRLSLALGVVATVFGIVLIAILWWMCRFYRRRSKLKAVEEKGDLAPTIIYYSPPPPPPLSIFHKSPPTEIRATVSRSHSSIDERTAPTTLCGGSVSPEHELDTRSVIPDTPLPVHLTGEPHVWSPHKIYAPFPVYTRSSDMAYGSDPPSPSLSPAVTSTSHSRYHSPYTPKRASTSSYYEAADEVVGAAPRRTSTSDIYLGGSSRYGRAMRSSLAGDIPYRGPAMEV